MSPAELAAALGMLLGAELRPGAVPAVPGLPPSQAVHPVADALAPLLPAGGLSGQLGIDARRRGATTLLFALLAAATSKGLWCAIVDEPCLYPLSAIAVGVNLERLALVETPGVEGRLAAIGVLCEGIPVLVASTRGFTARRLQRAASRASRSGTAIIWLEHHPTPRLDARMAVASCQWLGLRQNENRRWGSGRFDSCRLHVTAAWRGGRRASTELWPYGRESSSGFSAD